MDGYWALVTTYPNCERRAAQNLHVQGISSFAPTFKKVQYKGGERHERKCFLFPSYLFVRVHNVWRSLLYTRGILSIVGGFKPARVPDGIVEDFLSAEHSGGGAITLPFTFGQKLRVTCGALKGEIVIYNGMGRHDRERVLLNAMGSQITVELCGRDLEAA
jgi:transcription antitermination factor NusG